MSRNYAQRSAWWWPLALAVFALSAFAAIVLAAGTAHADAGDASPAGESQSKESPASNDVKGAPAAAERSDATATERSGQPSDDPTNGSIVRHTETVVQKAEQPRVDGPTAVDDTPPSATPTTPPTPASTEESSTRQSSLLDLKPRLAARSTVDLEAEPTTAKSATTTIPIPPPSNVVSLPTALPNEVAAHQEIKQFVRQVVGLVSDAGIVGASLVNNLAAHAAMTIGPQPFWGLPYTVATAVADSAANVSKVLSGTPLDATSVGPFKVNYGVLDVLSFFTPTKVPAGANDPSITVTAEHPLPVILVNGTVETQSLNWSVGAPVLANAGYKVYTFNYGNVTPYPNYPIQSTADIRQSAVELSDEIDRVLAETGAAKVILVGHSQGGGILPVYYINELGGADKVSQLIGLAPSNHGTDFNGLVGLQMLPILGPLLFAASDLIGPALGQQVVTSPFQQVVYGNGDTRPGVLYTTIASTNDEVVTPYTQQALVGPGVTNIVLQDLYPGLPAGHVGVAFIPQAWESVLDALAANPQANPLQVEELTAA